MATMTGPNSWKKRSSVVLWFNNCGVTDSNRNNHEEIVKIKLQSGNLIDKLLKKPYISTSETMANNETLSG